MKLECIHVATCLSGYWSGHHLPHVATPVYNNMTMPEIKESIKSELQQGAIAGSFDWALVESDEWFAATLQAVEDIKPHNPNQTEFFTDLEPQSDDDDMSESVYAYFVFREVE